MVKAGPRSWQDAILVPIRVSASVCREPQRGALGWIPFLIFTPTPHSQVPLQTRVTGSGWNLPLRDRTTLLDPHMSSVVINAVDVNRHFQHVISISSWLLLHYCGNPVSAFYLMQEEVLKNVQFIQKFKLKRTPLHYSATLPVCTDVRGAEVQQLHCWTVMFKSAINHVLLTNLNPISRSLAKNLAVLVEYYFSRHKIVPVVCLAMKTTWLVFEGEPL